MELLAFGDPHIKPAGATIDYDALRIPDGIDAIVTNGDVVHRTGPDDLAAGREFFERLAEADVPVVSVPGNHDPLSSYDDLVGDLESVVLAHDRVVAGDGERVDGRRALAPFDVVGWGCETFDCKPEVRLTSFDALDPRDEPDRRYAADEAASRLEDAVFDYVTGDRDRHARDELAAELGVRRDERPAFRDQLAAAAERFDRLDDLLARASSPTVFLSHVPPYNTELDRHRSVGDREPDLDGLHVGSLSAKLAVRAHDPVAALSGHSHTDEYQPGLDGRGGTPHFLSLDFRGVVRLSIDGANRTFGYEFL